MCLRCWWLVWLSAGVWGFPTGIINDICAIEELSSNKGITTIMWNCRSLFNKMGEAIHIIDTSDADLVIFVESWLINSIPHQGHASRTKIRFA